MKASIGMLLIPLALLMASAESSALIKQAGPSTRTDVFKEVATGGTVPQGFADLYITASFKTHHPGAYSAKDPHGTPGYRLQLNVDGQAVVLSGELQPENLSLKKLGDPEAGAGIRYRFRKVVRLKEGTHRISVSLPADNIAIAKDFRLEAGKENRLVLEPVYGRVMEKKRPSSNKSTGFRKGISRIIMNFNGRHL